MATVGQQSKVETVSLSDIAGELRDIPLFASLSVEDLAGIGDAERLSYDTDAVLTHHLLKENVFWVILDGLMRVERIERDESRTVVMRVRKGENFGETHLLRLKPPDIRMVVIVEEPSTLLRFTEQEFWHMMNCCPQARNVVLDKMVQRMKSFQAESMHREKLISLGTMAAGLMHELHNPGSAAKRASSQLRQNIMQMQQLSLKFCDMDLTSAQAECMHALQEQAFRSHSCSLPMNSLDQADAEEDMGAWLEREGVENAYRVAPSLVSVGMVPDQLACAKAEFGTEGFSEALNWLESLISSVSLVGSIEESISRISDLVGSVKRFAYNDNCALRDINVHEGMASTLTLLGHKLRQRQVEVKKYFDATQATIPARGSALTQVWMNLLDNAIDAVSAEGGLVEIRTWLEEDTLIVSIIDNGKGIPKDVLEHIYEPFFTTKPVGKGTGLGLEIAHRIVTESYGGEIRVDSVPGRTEFQVRLPRAVA